MTAPTYGWLHGARADRTVIGGRSVEAVLQNHEHAAMLTVTEAGRVQLQLGKSTLVGGGGFHTVYDRELGALVGEEKGAARRKRPRRSGRDHHYLRVA